MLVHQRVSSIPVAIFGRYCICVFLWFYLRFTYSILSIWVRSSPWLGSSQYIIRGENGGLHDFAAISVGRRDV